MNKKAIEVKRKFENAQKKLSSSVVDRDEIIESVLIASLAKEHILMIGVPGVAKSLIARNLSLFFSGEHYYEYLLTKFTSPDEIFGPFSIKGLENDKFYRITSKKLPEASIVFLDEIFKANSAILNSLLTILNERIYHNNGHKEKCPLVSVIGASNELPNGPELAALYDRFLIKHMIEPIDQSRFINYLMAKINPPEVSEDEIITPEELNLAQKDIKNMSLDEEIYDTFLNCKDFLEEVKIFPSDRTWRKCINIIKSYSWFHNEDGDYSVKLEHLIYLRNVLWSEPLQYNKINDKLIDTVKPLKETIDNFHKQSLDWYRNAKKEFVDSGKKDVKTVVEKAKQLSLWYEETQKVLESQNENTKRYKSAKELSDKIFEYHQNLIDMALSYRGSD